ncbi:small ribosomal subunit protein uS11-like [Antedon mediterranea]|uniref:small ribosomal subunit protein uS11-like n=1 Tax=Antedon mediterranea TaxID=105859 RepID=UPI003AF8BFD5
MFGRRKMATSIRVLASRFRQIVLNDQIFNGRSLTSTLRVHPALRSTFHTCSIRYTSENHLNKVENESRSENDKGNDEQPIINQKPSRIGEDSLVFNGVPFDDIAIAHIRATWNNTLVVVVDPTVTSNIVSKASCGTEGFKNAKKGTSVAAQSAAMAAATKALDKGVKMVRVIVKGIGPGRQASIKGLQMAGLEIISITDNTPVPHGGCRPRKARRL